MSILFYSHSSYWHIKCDVVLESTELNLSCDWSTDKYIHSKPSYSGLFLCQYNELISILFPIHIHFPLSFTPDVQNVSSSTENINDKKWIFMNVIYYNHYTSSIRICDLIHSRIRSWSIAFPNGNNSNTHRTSLAKNKIFLFEYVR